MCSYVCMLIQYAYDMYNALMYILHIVTYYMYIFMLLTHDQNSFMHTYLL